MAIQFKDTSSTLTTSPNNNRTFFPSNFSFLDSFCRSPC